MDLASFDPVTGMWTVDAGKYALGIGASFTDIRTTDYFQVAEALSLSV